jgi:hypothetical protein
MDRYGGMMEQDTEIRGTTVIRLKLSIGLFLVVAACVPIEPTRCTTSVLEADIKLANDLVGTFEEETWGPGQANALFSTYELDHSSKCGDIVILEMSPRAPKLGDTEVIVGSAVRYTVNLRKKTVEQLYLE